MENTGKKAIYISVAELAEMLGISRVAVFKKIKKAKFPLKRLVVLMLFPWNTLVNWLVM